MRLIKIPLLLFALLAFSGTAFGGAAESQRTAEHDYDAPVSGTYTLPVIKLAADGAVLEASGKAVHLRELFRGRIAVLSFIYTRCAGAKACPYATGVLLQLHRASAGDGQLEKRLRLVSLSFDPVNDTPARMAVYAGVASESPSGVPWIL